MKCLRCEHEQCPMCLDWCDVMVRYSDGEWGPCECLYSDNEGCIYNEKET